MRGRVIKTNKAKWLSGTRRGIKRNPIAEIAKSFDCPSWMPEHGKELWKDLAPKLLRLNVLSNLDHSGFQGLCLSYHLMKQAGLELSTQGLTTMGDRGIKKNPAFSIFKANSELYLKFSETFGLNPRSRQLLDIHPEEGNDPLEDFLLRKRETP